jgi:thiol-disulfide isomerase/thioredoxin
MGSNLDMRVALGTFFFIGLLVLFAGCGPAGPVADGPAASGTPPASAWLEIELEDVVTGEPFRASDFRGRPVFVQSFAVWCPTCGAQLREMKEVLERTDAVLVALDTDPNEDADSVRQHVERNGFSGSFAIAPANMTALLLDEFGPEIVAVPTAPVILISADQTSARLLDRGLKRAEELARAADSAR